MQRTTLYRRAATVESGTPILAGATDAVQAESL
jgi:hypothetical protein